MKIHNEFDFVQKPGIKHGFPNLYINNNIFEAHIQTYCILYSAIRVMYM